MTDQAPNQPQTQPPQEPLFPVPKHIWTEVVAILGNLPWKISNAWHDAAKESLDNTHPQQTHVIVNANFFNGVTSLLADQPSKVVGDVMKKITEHVTAMTTAAKELSARAAQAMEQAASTATAAVESAGATIVSEVELVRTGSSVVPVEPVEEVSPAAAQTEAPTAEVDQNKPVEQTRVIEEQASDLKPVAIVETPAATEAQPPADAATSQTEEPTTLVEAPAAPAAVEVSTAQTEVPPASPAL
jgi:hypothetical protein